jgi:hypothetical protein
MNSFACSFIPAKAGIQAEKHSNTGIFWIPAFAGMTVRAGCLTIHSSVECVMHDALRQPAKQLRFSKMPRECGCEEADKSPLPALAPP